jgi:predicted O-methyltransferase YrrM
VEPALQRLLAEIAAAGQAHDAAEPEHRRRRLNLEPETAELVAVLVRSGRRRRVLEIGTSNGYSTIWLARSLRATGGHLVSVERDAGKQAEADANLRRAGLREEVELVCGDATEAVRDLPGPFDCVFFDADRVSAPAQLELLLPKLEPDALLIADNARSHPEEIAAYLGAVGTLPGFFHVVVPVGKGLSVACRTGTAGLPPPRPSPTREEGIS